MAGNSPFSLWREQHLDRLHPPHPHHQHHHSAAPAASAEAPEAASEAPAAPTFSRPSTPLTTLVQPRAYQQHQQQHPATEQRSESQLPASASTSGLGALPLVVHCGTSLSALVSRQQSLQTQHQHQQLAEAPVQAQQQDQPARGSFSALAAAIEPPPIQACCLENSSEGKGKRPYLAIPGGGGDLTISPPAAGCVTS